MKPGDWDKAVFLFISIGIVIPLVLLLTRNQQPETQMDNVLPHDDFDSATLHQIQADLQQNMGGTPPNHEVYMLTGGIGVANPRIMGWDAWGSMTLGGKQPGDPIYNLQETADSPANWFYKLQGNGVMWTNGPQPGLKRVPWVLKHTASDFPYYEWDIVHNDTIQFYFKKNKTFIILRVDAMNHATPNFPEGIPSHLVPSGNPVKP